jgi:hypothetical protein
MPLLSAQAGAPASILPSTVSATKPPAPTAPYQARRPTLDLPGRGPDRFPGAEQLDARESAPDTQGHITRTRLVRTDFKYPLVRLEETVARNGTAGDETLVRQTAMAGDHIMVKARPGTSPAAIAG